MIKREIVFSFGSNKGENKDYYSPQLTRPQNKLLMRIFDTTKKYLYTIEGKSDMLKVHTSSVKSSSTLFYCSIRTTYKKMNSAK